MYTNLRLITLSVQLNCGCAADCVCCAPFLSVCDVTRMVSDTEVDLFRAVYGLCGNVPQTQIPK